MIKPAEVKPLDHTDLQNITKVEQSIDELLKKTRGYATHNFDISGFAEHKVFVEIVRRYRNAGWVVEIRTRDEHRFTVRILHEDIQSPNFSADHSSQSTA